MEIKGLHCPNCGKEIIQNPNTRINHFCSNNKKCYFEWYGKVGSFRKAMEKHFKKHPETRIKNRQRAKKYSDEKRGPREPLYCRVCGKLIEDLMKTKHCSEKCQKIWRARENVRYYWEVVKPRNDAQKSTINSQDTKLNNKEE